MKLIDIFINPDKLPQELYLADSAIEYERCFTNNGTLNHSALCIFLQEFINEATIKYFDYTIEQQRIILINIENHIEDTANLLIKQYVEKITEKLWD